MATKDNNNGEYLFIDVDMDGGADVKMEHVVVPPIEDMVIVDVNEGIDNAIGFVVQVGMVVAIEFARNTCPPSNPFESNLQSMCILNVLNDVAQTLLASMLTNERKEDHGIGQDSVPEVLPWLKKIVKHIFKQLTMMSSGEVTQTSSRKWLKVIVREKNVKEMARERTAKKITNQRNVKEGMGKR
jgi:hypothetical protein